MLLLLTGTDTGTGSGPPVVGAYVMDVHPRQYAVSGTNAEFLRSRLTDAAAGAYAIIGTAADLQILGAYDVDAGPGAYAVIGTNAVPLRSRLVDATSGAYTIIGTAADLTVEASEGLGPIWPDDTTVWEDA